MTAFCVPGVWTTVLALLSASFSPSAHRSARSARSALAGMLSGGGGELDVGLGSDLRREYAGSLLGVSASASLDFRDRQANVSLWGVPIAGSVNGSGWLESTTTGVAGKVTLDPEMEARLRRRGVRVVSAALDLPSDSLSVTVDVPIFGQQTLRLKRVLE